MSGDQFMRNYAAGLPVPEFPNPAFVTPTTVADATVAIVTSAALHSVSGEADGSGARFTAGDTSYRVLPSETRDLVLGHWSPNFDHTGFAMDINVVYPIDRLDELAAAGTIGAVAPRHISFAGNQPDDVATIRHDSGPAAAAELVADGVDIVLLTPV